MPFESGFGKLAKEEGLEDPIDAYERIYRAVYARIHQKIYNEAFQKGRDQMFREMVWEMLSLALEAKFGAAGLKFDVELRLAYDPEWLEDVGCRKMQTIWNSFRAARSVDELRKLLA